MCQSLDLYGYRCGEISLPKPGPIKDNARAKCSSTPRELKSRPMMTSLGCHIPFVPPVCDTTCPKTALVGAAKRFLCDTSHMKPPHNLRRAETMRLRNFVRWWLKRNLTPLSTEDTLDFQTWLENTNYSFERKQSLKQTWESRDREEKLLLQHRATTKVKSFVKLEHYEEYKHARSINARSDMFKCLSGPIFKAIETKVFSINSFIKKVPCADRPDLIRNSVVEGEFGFASDYSAFEAHFTKDLMRAVEFELYSYMTRHLPEHEMFMMLCNNVLAGRNHCSYRDFSLDVDATRMSGEMCTSLGNGFTNLMVIEFLSKKLNNPVRCWVEGDDSLCFWKHANMPTTKDFSLLGFDVKIQTYDQPTQASFCGMVFDLHKPSVVTDPRYVLATFAWANGKYSDSKPSRKLELLRAKSLSVKAQYPGCPILEKLADYGLRVTSGISISQRYLDSLDSFKKDEMTSYVKRKDFREIREIHTETRTLVENLYGIPIALQLSLENYLDSLNDIKPLEMNNLDMIMPTTWSHCFHEFTGQKNLWDRPPKLYDDFGSDYIGLFNKKPWFLESDDYKPLL